jgi:hypothetical protein
MNNRVFISNIGDFALSIFQLLNAFGHFPKCHKNHADHRVFTLPGCDPNFGFAW